MRIVIYGAGAVGGVIGARLHDRGYDVALIARGEHLDALVSRGLELVTPTGRSRHEIPAYGHPREVGLGPTDVVLLTTKTQHTIAALEDLRGCGVDPPIFCAQNGVANERMAARRFSRVYAMLVWLPATFLEPGRVIGYSSPNSGLLDAGCYPSGTDDVVREVTGMLDSSRLVARPTPDILRWKYYKLLGNLRNALIATLGPGVDTEDLPARLRAEAIAVYEAAGIDWVPEDVEAERRNHADMKVSMIEGEPPLMGSSWQSLTRGGSIETDYLNGEIVLQGRLHGVATPVNRALQVAANRLAREGGKPGDLSLAELRSLVDEYDSPGAA